MNINYKNSVAVQVYKQNVDSETSISKKIGFGVAASLTALVETVARGIFGIISLPAFAASGVAYLLGKDNNKVGINFFANNFKAIGEIFTSLFKEIQKDTKPVSIVVVPKGEVVPVSPQEESKVPEDDRNA